MSVQVISVDPSKKCIAYRATGSSENMEMHYDKLISTAHIDELVKYSRIVPDLRLQHNTVFLSL